MEGLLRVENLSKGFGNRLLFAGLSLRLERGETLAVTGPSGCGKSTLLNILGLLEEPDSGSVWLDGVLYPKVGARGATLLRRSHINYVFQSFALIESASVEENLRLALRYDQLSRRDEARAVAAALEPLGLQSRAESSVNELSGGEKQRVAIARAMLKPGDLVLADEPTGSLDEAMANRVADMLVGNVVSRGKALLVVTHAPEIAARCQRVLRLAS